MGEFGDGAAVFHVGAIAAGSKYAPNTHKRVSVGGGDHSTGSVVDESGQFDRKATLSKSGLKGRNDVLTFHTINVEAFGPALEDAMVDVVLGGRIGKGETERELLNLLIAMVILDELLQAVGNIGPQLVGGACLELLRHAVFGLYDVKFTLFFSEGDFADAEVGAAHVKGKEGARFVAVGEGHAPGGVHRLLQLGGGCKRNKMDLRWWHRFARDHDATRTRTGRSPP